MNEALSPITLFFIIANVVVSMMGFSNPSLLRAYLFDTKAILGNNEHVRLITSGFLHGDWNHLLFNMLSFYFFAPSLEQIPGDGPA
jgi:membrane associated rhomboid family serine protease